MKHWQTTAILLLFPGPTFAGFRHPIEQSGAEAIAIQQTRVERAPTTSMPKTSSLSAAAEKIRITDRKLFMPRERPPTLQIHGANRAQIHSFLRQARSLKLPSREYNLEVRSREIASHYAKALQFAPFRSFRSPYQLHLAPIASPVSPPAAMQYENMVKRIDALFLGLDAQYPRATLALWQLSESSTNALNLQARDALFAGILSERAGWETAASNLLEASALKKVDQQARYLGLLWSQLDKLESGGHVDRVVAKVSSQQAQLLAKAGDKANFAMTKRLSSSSTKTDQTLAKEFEQRIQSPALREKIQLLRAIISLRSSDDTSEKTSAMETLRSLESTGTADTQQEARLAIARALLKNGSAPEALSLYKNVTKNGKNRLEVVAEQTYAEYMTGNFSDSLGKTMGLQSPYFQYGFSPDVHLVEILSRKAICDFGGAERGVQRFFEHYGRELEALENVLQRNVSDSSFYHELIGYHELQQPLRFQRYLLHLSIVMENQKTLNQAVRNLKVIDELGAKRHTVDRPAGWNDFAEAMHGVWRNKAAELRLESARAALAEATYLAKRLRHAFAQVELLNLDISTSATKHYNAQSAMNFPVRQPADSVLEKDKMRWPFEKEVWEDEIDFLKMKNPSKCALNADSATP